MSISDTKKVFHVASDHAGFLHKETIIKWLKEEGLEVVDYGALAYEEGDDFPDFISLAAAAVGQAPLDSLGLIFGGSGQGEAIMANRFANVRAVVFYGGDLEIIKLGREHNDANMLSFGARFVTPEEVKECIELWLRTPVLLDEKYKRRNQKIERITRTLRNI